MEYLPARWLPGAHAMTIVGALHRPFAWPRTVRERWELPDGDFLDVDRAAGPAPDAPVLVVCHGLEASSRAAYVRGLVHLARARGFAALAMNFRSCSGTPNRLPRSYHSGETGDLALVVERLAAERPGRRIALCGFSLGGNVVAKYLGERGEDLPAEVAGAAVISVPFDLARCARALDGPGFWNSDPQLLTVSHRKREVRSQQKGQASVPCCSCAGGDGLTTRFLVCGALVVLALGACKRAENRPQVHPLEPSAIAITMGI